MKQPFVIPPRKKAGHTPKGVDRQKALQVETTACENPSGGLAGFWILGVFSSARRAWRIGIFLRLKRIRAGQLQVHAASFRDTVDTPLAHGALRAETHLGDFRRSAEAVNYLACCLTHGLSIAAYTRALQAPEPEKV